MSRAHFSRAGGGVLGIVTTVVYYGLIQLGDGLIQSGTLNAPLGVWLPNILLGIVGLVLMLRLKRMSAFGRDTDRPRSREPRRRTNRDDSALKLRRFALQRYVAGRFVAMVAFCFAVLLVAYLAVDILERLQIFARYNATGSVVLRFYGARIPLLASRVLPMALLVATALTVSLLAVQGELMGMKSCGISAPRALLPILVICAVIAPCYFLLSNEVLPRTNALASYLKEFEIKVEPLGERKHTDIWYRADHRIYQAERFDPQAGTARNITVYELGNGGLPVSRADARGARHIGGGVWRLVDPVRVQLAGLQFERVPAGPFADLGEAVPAEVDTRHLSVGELRREIREVEASGYDATVYRVDLWVKLAAPIACLVLPALALFFAVAGPPHPSSSLVLMLSVAVSVSYVLLTGVGTSLGYGGALPPIVAGWGPTSIFAVLAVYFGLRLRGFGQGF